MDKKFIFVLSFLRESRQVSNGSPTFCALLFLTPKNGLGVESNVFTYDYSHACSYILTYYIYANCMHISVMLDEHGQCMSKCNAYVSTLTI